MESVAKQRSAKGLIVRLLLLGVCIVLLRFAYVVARRGGSCFSGDFCFFSPASEVLSLRGGVSHSEAAYVRIQDGLSLSGETRQLWTSREYRKAVEFYSAVFQDLVGEGFLSPCSKSLCIDSASGHEVIALKEIGITDVVGISRKKLQPLVLAGDIFHQPFANNTFDFVFAGGIDRTRQPANLAGEIARVLKPEGFLVILSTFAGDLYSLNSLEILFPSLKIIRSREIEVHDSPKLLREIVFQKANSIKIRYPIEDKPSIGGNLINECPIPEHKLQLLRSAEPLIEEEPQKPWITLKKNIKNIKYLPSMTDISFKQRYIYIDVGARSYGSSIGSWFKKQYPKQNRTFEVYAVEADKAFHEEYASKKGVTLLPFAAWVRNESLSFVVNHDSEQKDDEKGHGMGRIRPAAALSDDLSSRDMHVIQGLDFAEWLKRTVTEKDFLVMKMDVEGTEFDLMPRLFETGAICLIDELFLECHYNRWQRCCPGKRSPKYQKTYGQCIDLFSSLRQRGVLVHQWW
ncbi:hypothetical protein HPP92_002842 [Vanilla planifolia]|uniref:Methyltransferase type 11 domain-containing protein n=1 Tax=Vanilla planifolia TaxID=51239 RepID=A0A835S986_VANPL|nr:hypothetical protein HPP92_002842 [Vanilla planifolia]